MSKKLTVLILAAGYGRRMGPFSQNINKGLLPYNNKPLISHIFDKFDTLTTDFIIACGHLGHQIKAYVDLVHPDKNITCVDIPDYSEISTGPATSIVWCAKYLQQGFLWISCDTLFDFNYQDFLDHNWIAVHPVDSKISQDYCWVSRHGEKVTSIQNKVVSDTAVDAFIGVMYCKDNQYIQNLVTCSAKQPHEGFPSLELKAHTVANWLDFGTYEKWQKLNCNNPEFAFIKSDELFYIDNQKVVKFNTNLLVQEKKLLRVQLNPGCMPDNVQTNGQFLAYDLVEGNTFYQHATAQRMCSLLQWLKSTVWHKRWFPNVEDMCKEFYHEKTLDRIKKFRQKYPSWEEPVCINGNMVRPMEEYLNRIDWNFLYETVEWGFIHGDCHWDNIIFNPDNCSFTVIDWRTDFAGSSYGDIYYDLAKMSCGIFCNFNYLKNNNVEFSENNHRVELTIEHVKDWQSYHNILHDWCKENHMSWQKVCLLLPLIFLNISALHSHPYDKFLFCLAQLKFAEYFDGF